MRNSFGARGAHISAFVFVLGLGCSDVVLLDADGGIIPPAGDASTASDQAKSPATGDMVTVAAPSCTDGAKNGTETDVDCGGSCSQKCHDSEGCVASTDCVSGICAFGKCAAASPSSCTNGAKDGTETDVDCGGSCSTKCDLGKACKVHSDCKSLGCDPGTLQCRAALNVGGGASLCSSGLVLIVYDNAGNPVVGTAGQPLVAFVGAGWNGYAVLGAKCGGAYVDWSAYKGKSAKDAGLQIYQSGEDISAATMICAPPSWAGSGAKPFVPMQVALRGTCPL